MSSTTKGGVLLVPDPIDLHDFLSEGPFGARPPIAFRGPRCAHDHHRVWVTPSEYRRDCYMCGDYPERGLVLRWAGEEVAEGFDRASRVIRTRYSSLRRGSFPGDGQTASLDIFPGRAVGDLRLVAQGVKAPEPFLPKWLLSKFDIKLCLL